MTPKEKAEKLVDDMYSCINTIEYQEAVQCALVAVDEIINELYDGREKATKHNNSRIKYWQEVKQEIEKL